MKRPGDERRRPGLPSETGRFESFAVAGRRAWNNRACRTENILLREEWSRRYGFPRIIGDPSNQTRRGETQRGPRRKRPSVLGSPANRKTARAELFPVATTQQQDGRFRRGDALSLGHDALIASDSPMIRGSRNASTTLPAADVLCPQARLFQGPLDQHSK